MKRKSKWNKKLQSGTGLIVTEDKNLNLNF